MALLVGISIYPDGSGWHQIHADNDIRILKLCFSPQWKMMVLENDKATYNGIVSELSKLATNANNGDTVFIHFSCHGQQMLALNQNKEPDHLDESLIPYDAKKMWSSSYHGEKHIRDSYFSTLIDKIRKKGAVLIVILDACHSDSMHKDPQEKKSNDKVVYRGTGDIFGEEITDELLKKRYLQDTSSISKSGGDVLYISACMTFSKNCEITARDNKMYGPLSYSVAEVMSKSGIGSLRYFAEQIEQTMKKYAYYQRPRIRASFDYHE